MNLDFFSLNVIQRIPILFGCIICLYIQGSPGDNNNRHNDNNTDNDDEDFFLLLNIFVSSLRQLFGFKLYLL